MSVFALLMLCCTSCGNLGKDDFVSDFRDQILISAIQEDIKLSAFLGESSLKDDIVLSNFEAKISSSVNEFFGSEKLVFYFESAHCITCIENELQLLKKLFKSDQVVLWTKNYSRNSIQVLKKVHRIPFEIWTMEPQENFVNISWNRPIYFKLGKDGKFKHVYSAKYSYLELSETYLECMVKHVN